MEAAELIKKLRENVKEQRCAFPMFGVECSKGWEALYLPLLQLCDLLGIEVHQVKEKFGGLRFYVGGVKTELFEMVHAFIDSMEHLSYSTCEECGIENNQYRDNDYEHKVKVTTEGSWLLTLCEKCRKERDERRAK